MGAGKSQKFGSLKIHRATASNPASKITRVLVERVNLFTLFRRFYLTLFAKNLVISIVSLAGFEAVAR
jgi:hypothetical protein